VRVSVIGAFCRDISVKSVFKVVVDFEINMDEKSDRKKTTRLLLTP